LEQAVAAPFATRQLADLGARVIKVERPEVGDFARSYDRTVKGLSSHFVWLNRSKESLTLDLKQDGPKEVLSRLVEHADVFVQNLAPGATERLGFGAKTLRERHPRLIVCDVSGYGSSGPYRDKKAYDLLVQCEGGLVSITGTPETPSKVGISIADMACSMYAYSGILAALLRRGRTSEGATLEVSLFEALGEWMGFPAYFTLYGGKEPPRTGASHAAIAPYGPFECDGELIFLGIQNEREWKRFCEVVLEQPALAGYERFESNSERVENVDALRQAIEGILEQLSSEEAIGPPRRGKDRQRPDEEHPRLPRPSPARSPRPVEGGGILGRPSARPPASRDHGRYRAGHGPDPLHRGAHRRDTGRAWLRR